MSIRIERRGVIATSFIRKKLEWVAVSGALDLVKHNDSASQTTIPGSIGQSTGFKHAVQVTLRRSAVLKIRT